LFAGGDPHQHFVVFATGFVPGQHLYIHLVAAAAHLFQSQAYRLFDAAGLNIHLSHCHVGGFLSS
jgi:hypothetical protein